MPTDQIVLKEVLEAEQRLMPVVGHVHVPFFQQKLGAAGLDDRLEHEAHGEDGLHGVRQLLRRMRRPELKKWPSDFYFNSAALQVLENVWMTVLKDLGLEASNLHPKF